MKTLSNIQLPKAPIKWKGDEMAVFANHAYEGKSEEGDDVYSADLTISKGEQLESIMEAFTRQVNDKALDDAVIYNFEIAGVKAIDIKKEYKIAATADIFTPLPDKGKVKKGELYNNNGEVLQVEKDCDVSEIKISDDQIIKR